MPCRDDGWSQEDQQDKINKLTRELCEARATIIALSKLVNKTKMDDKTFKNINETFIKQKVHREKDKQRAIEEAKTEIDNLENKMNKIKQLGGETSKAQIRERKILIGKLEDITNADPMNTELF